jgi:hypothetical protein
MKVRWFLIILLAGLWLGPTPSTTFGKEATVPGRVASYDGKSYAGLQDPEFVSYDQALREYLVKRIDQEFGIALDPKKYSGFDLLEIEALFKCKKSNEPYELFLKMFPKRR